MFYPNPQPKKQNRANAPSPQIPIMPPAINMPSKTVLAIAAFSGCAAVILGAFGAHALRDSLAPALMNSYQVGVQYHFYHTFALLALGLLLPRLDSQAPRTGLIAPLFVSGIILFSGSLYVMALTGIRQLGMITPLGGLCFIAAWFLLGIEIVKQKKE